MTMGYVNAPVKLAELGQSIWYDNIQRGLLKSGELAGMIKRGEIRGVTSNPTIFQNAIANSTEYNDAIQALAWAGTAPESIFYTLAIQDIQDAADLLRSLYDESKKIDGYVSLEVSPYLANDTEKTIAEAKLLWQKVNRPNLCIKIPATLAGIPAIKEVIASGINVNVTLIFSIERYRQVMEAYLQGIEERVERNLPVDHIASVASFFVSRVDTKVDALLHKMVDQGQSFSKIEPLLGKAAVANAALAYSAFEEIFFTPRFERLKAAGAQYQRPLWASTSTKNPAYSDLIYVDNLVAPITVNTVPPQTLAAILDHCEPEVRIKEHQANASEVIEKIENLGISFSKVTSELEQEGVDGFSSSFTSLLKTIETRIDSYLKELGQFQKIVQNRLKVLAEENTLSKMFSKDPTVWTSNTAEHAEIQNRLGWLDSPITSLSLAAEINAFSSEIRQKGYSDIVLLGMGGSSMAPEVFALIGESLNLSKNGLKLTVLDTTDPRVILDAARTINPLKALYIVASKSGSTSEIDAMLTYFWHLTSSLTGDSCGEHFIAITDPGTILEKLAIDRKFLKIFNGDPSVGGRYSALTPFGLVPAALCGLEIEKVLYGAISARKICLPGDPAMQNLGAGIGAILGESYLAGKDKLTILSDPELESFGAWMEQLIAESSGKTGKGIIPVDGEPLISPGYYKQDRVFIYFKSSGVLQEYADTLLKSGQIVITREVLDDYALGAELYYWEYATAVACSIIGVNAFDQPDVQDSKIRTQAKLKSFSEIGTLAESTPTWSDEDFAVFPVNYTPSKHNTVSGFLREFLFLANPSDYIAINAYVPRDEHFSHVLNSFRRQVMQATGSATTLGFGPRFLHSTGQLHKGGPDNCLFIQITMDYAQSDLAIPGKPFTFGILQAAQAQGDLEALENRKRRVLRLHLKKGIVPDF